MTERAAAPAVEGPAVPMRRVALWLAAAGLWTLLPLLTSLQGALGSLYVGAPVAWDRLLPLRLADWYTCAVFTPFCFWLARRHRFEQGVWPRSLAVHLAAIGVMVVLKFALYVEVARRLDPSRRWDFGETLTRGFVSEIIAFWALLGIVHAIEYHRRLRERELRAARLETELAAARLDALAAQLQPHFLFNTLHGISTLMRRDVEAADEMLTHLGDLLRRTLRRGEGHEIALADELEILEHYLAIMQVRFQDRLTVSIDVDPSLRGVRVPMLILQPLVENAIQHGISRRPGAGRIEIIARRAGPSIEIRVRDDGEGAGESSPREGIGLSNTRRRLRELYGERQSLAFEPAEGGGLVAVVRLPLSSA